MVQVKAKDGGPGKTIVFANSKREAFILVVYKCDVWAFFRMLLRMSDHVCRNMDEDVEFCS